MNESPDNVLQYLTGADNIVEASLDDLNRLTNEYPYFSVGQVLLAKKLKTENSTAYLQQAQKTAVYFSNLFWLDYQLSNTVVAKQSAETPTATGELAAPEIVSEKVAPELPAEEQPEVDTAEEKQVKAASEEAHPVTTVFSASELETASNLAHKVLQENAPPHDEAEVQNSGEAVELPDTAASIPAASATAGEATETADEIIPSVEDTSALTNQGSGSLTVEPVTTYTAPPAEHQPSADRELEQLPPLRTRLLEEEDNPEEPEPLPDGADSPDEHEQMFRNIKAMLDATTDDADPGNATLPMDPYYTVDYFASQGIKLELDPNPKDELGKNLKKFTHWLRHMKKIGPQDAVEEITSHDTEAAVQRDADSSNTAREVVTEAMATVLEKQGKYDKAIELYNKLSFLNPSKSAYFAQKIQSLKKT